MLASGSQSLMRRAFVLNGRRLWAPIQQEEFRSHDRVTALWVELILIVIEGVSAQIFPSLIFGRKVFEESLVASSLLRHSFLNKDLTILDDKDGVEILLVLLDVIVGVLHGVR